MLDSEELLNSLSLDRQQLEILRSYLEELANQWNNPVRIMDEVVELAGTVKQWLEIDKDDE